MQCKGHSRSCTAGAKGWETRAKRNTFAGTNQTCSRPPSHSTLGKRRVASSPQMSPTMPCSCSALTLFSSFSPNSCRILIKRRQEGPGLGLWVLFAPLSRPRRVLFSPPQDPHPGRHPLLSNSITSPLHSCPPTARAAGWLSATRQPPILSFPRSVASCQCPAAPHQLLFFSALC